MLQTRYSSQGLRRAVCLSLFCAYFSAASVRLSADSTDSKFFAITVGANEVVLHVKGVIDGSNRLTLGVNSALWEQSIGSPAQALSINDLAWDWQHHRLLVLPDNRTLFPSGLNFRSVWVEPLKGKGLIACEPSDDKVVVYVDDMSQHPQPYDFILHFSTAPVSAIPHASSSPAHLKISAVVEGSDRLTITHDAAKWENLSWGPPTSVSLNNVKWSLDKTSEIKNEGDTQFLPADVDFSTAKVITRSGRDLVTAQGKDDQLIVYFGDTQSGSDQYEIEISFGSSQ